MTVRVADPSRDGHVELLCTVRALLKKMRERVLVGDHVRVFSIDWVESQGTPPHIDRLSIQAPLQRMESLSLLALFLA